MAIPRIPPSSRSSSPKASGASAGGNGPSALHLALQGGGAHGAFTWGVLERLLDEKDIDIGDVSGTSAGALNGAALVSGLLDDGRAGAKAQLKKLWHGIAAVGAPMSLLLTPLRKPGLGVWDDAMPLLSPYQTNPVAFEPVRMVLAGVVDIEALNGTAAHRLHVNAVHVQTGRCRVFGPGELSLDALLASACAPLMFQAVEIDGEPYWDGSYAGNPMLWPLYQPTLQADILLVELTPLERSEVPTTAKNILNRINEIASIHGLLGELRTIDAINRTAAADVRLHVVSLPEMGTSIETEPSIKRTVGIELFEMLRLRGIEACEAWLSAHAGGMRSRPPIDIAARYLAPYEPSAQEIRSAAGMARAG